MTQSRLQVGITPKYLHTDKTTTDDGEPTHNEVVVRLLKEDDDLVDLVTTLVTSGKLDG
jgi:hypothetical protein